MAPQYSALPLALAGVACSMVRAEWLALQNLLHAATRRHVGAEERTHRGGIGRHAARAQWVLRRSLARVQRRRRLAIVGRVRLFGKGPPTPAWPAKSA